MENKTLKFRDHLAKLILDNKKTTTWRLFDDKNLKIGDKIELINWDTKEKFGEAKITKMWEKTLGSLKDSDFDGHEKFESEEDMLAHYRKYYGDKVNLETIVKIINFELL